MLTIEITDPIPSKKNSTRWIRRGNRTFLVPSKKHEDFVKVWEPILTLKHKREAFSGSLGIDVLFLRVTRRRFDAVNKYETILDLLVDCGIIPDDSVDYLMDEHLSWQWSDHEGAIITLREMEPSSDQIKSS